MPATAPHLHAVRETLNPGHHQQATVLFDFDGTLVRGDNGTRMILVFARSRGWPLLPMLLLSPLLLPLLLIPPTKHIGASAYLWLSTVGMQKRSINACLKTLAKHTAAHPEIYRINAAWKRLRQHQQAGDRIVVVTGCWEKLAKKTLKAMGLKKFTIVGSRKQRWLGGYISRPHCYGPNKIICLAEKRIFPPWIVAYTDSVSDRYLFQLADKKVLVQPTNYSLLRMRRLFADIELLQ